MSITQDDLKRIKSNINTSYTYSKQNVDRFNFFRKYVFETSITQDQRAMLKTLNKPAIEANILEAYISRLLGEFAKHEPSIIVKPAEGNPVPSETLDIVEGFIRHLTYEANKNGMSYEVYKDTLSGGFSVTKVWTEYASPMSMKQVIKRDRAFDPTLCGFDPMARASHKGDGQYCFELFPMLEEDFKREFPDANAAQVKYSRNIEGFNWSYKNAQGENTVLVGDYYEKKKRRTKITQLANGRVMRVADYKKLIKYWDDNQFIEQIPVPVGKPRWTILETICRYKVTEHEIINYEETDYTYLPLIFVDGNSILLREGKTNSVYQMTRPYIYQARGIQDLKNFSMQCLANYLENMVMHKFIVKKEALPQEEDYLEALKNMQEANTIVVNAYSENNPDKPIPEPIREVANVPAPPEVMAAFQITDPTTQTILGSYASNLGQNDNDLSGKAVIESASVGNAASMPFIVGYLAAETQAANIIVDLLPKYIRGKRQLPVVTKEGDNKYEQVNQEGSPYLDYEQAALNVVIEAGVNFQVQKERALQQITSLMQASQEFAAFMNDDESLPILVDNLTVYGADRLQEAVPKWVQKKAQMQQQQQQMQEQMMQKDPSFIKAQADMMKAQADSQIKQIEMQMKQKQQEFDNQIEIARQATENKLADARVLEAEAKISQSQIDSAVALEKANTSLEVHALDAAAKIAEVQGREHAQRIAEHDQMLKHKKLEHEMSKKDADTKHVSTTE